MKTIDSLFGKKWTSQSRNGRIPVDYLVSPEADAILRASLRVSSERDLLDSLGLDFYYLSGRDLSQNEGILPCYYGDRLEFSEMERTCPLQIRWRRKVRSAKFSVDEAIHGPFDDNSSIDDILKFPWPKADDFDFSSLAVEAEQHADRIVVGGFWSGIFGDSYRMLGLESFLNAMASRPDLVHALVDRMTDMYLDLNERYFTQLSPKMDVWFFGNDFGSQRGLLFSTKMWDDFFADNIRRLTSLAHRHGLVVMMHSCGGIAPLIDRLIDAGVDVLDPVQTSATGMEPMTLREKFGGRIVFHGGIDTQHILVNGSTEDVCVHVRDVIETLGGNGGYIFAPSQIFQPDIPVENILAAYQTVRDYNEVRSAVS